MALDELLTQIPTVSDSPEETPEDLLRQQMMQRLGVALNPQAVAQKAAAERLGQTGQGVGGWLQRILGGAAEGVRFAQDPKYRGAFAEELGRAQEQEKNLMPYARQLEMSSAMREKARLEAREKERATAAKVFATIKQDAQAKIKSDIQRAKVNQEIEESRAKIELLQAQGKFNEAREELQRMQNKLFEKIGRTQASEAMSNAAVLQDVSKFTDMTGEQAQQGLTTQSQTKALGPAMVAAIRGLTGRSGGSTSRTFGTRLMSGGEDEMGRPLIMKIPTETVTVRGGGSDTGSTNPVISGILKAMGASKDVLQAFPGAEQPATSPTPESRGAAALGARPKPVNTPPPVGTAGAPSVITGTGFKTRQAQQDNDMRLQEIGLAQEIRHNVGARLGDVADRMGLIMGSDVVNKLLKGGQAIGAIPEFQPILTQLRADITEARVLRRLITTGKAMNLTEMQEIKDYMPDMQDTPQQALIKSIRREILNKGNQAFLETGRKEPLKAGRVTAVREYIYNLYEKAYSEKSREERRERIEEIEKVMDKNFIWRLLTDDKLAPLLKGGK